MSWCTCGVGLQDLPFIDNSRLGSILRFQRFYCLIWFLKNSYCVTQLCPYIFYTTSTISIGYPLIIMLFVKLC